MPLIKKMKHATRTEVSITTTYGAAKLSVFEHQSGCSNPDMLMLVSHGFQITPARTISGSNQALACFAFLVPIGVSLKRTRYDNWANLLASQFADAPLAFACAGTPDIMVGAHYIEPEDKNYATALEQALTICHIAVFDDITRTLDSDNSYNSFAVLPLAALLNGAPSLRRRYSNFLLHCCRSRWDPAATSKSTGTQATAQGLYAFDDQFRTWLD